MKQLTILAPALSAPSLFSRLLRFSVKQVSHIFHTPQRLVGKWRLYLNYCPECNSCAPKLHQCDVCKADTKSYFSWNREVEQTWWKRYSDKHHLAA